MHTLTVTLAHLSKYTHFAAPSTPTTLDPQPEQGRDAQRLYLPSVLSGVTPPCQETLETIDAAEPIASDTETTAAPAPADGMVLPDRKAMSFFLPLAAR